ncbi:MAG: hydroxyacylglutathione hydrolase, partial [Polaribacter sp.]
MSDSGFKIHALELGPMLNFVYLIEDIATRRTAVVDPAWDTPAIITEAQKLDLKITDILLTHSHHDHINGIEGILEHSHAEIHLLKPEFEFWDSDISKPCLHHGGDEITLGESQIKVLHTPGHTPGSACYQLGNEIITGDTLFV